MMSTGAGWNWTLLRAGGFMLDGGAMFGVIPMPLWTRLVKPDDRNRIPVQTNCLLLERGGHIAVIEVGNGDKFGPKERDIYGMEDRSILDALHEADCPPEDVRSVIISHLHFDHAGGLTRKPRAGEGGGPQLTFPNAEIIVQRREWEDAIANRSTMSKTYLRDHLTEGVRDRLKLLDGPAAPDPVLEAEEVRGEVFPGVEVLPGVEVVRIPGHTWGQQGVRFRAADGSVVVFVPDVMPTVHHASAAANMAYDVEPWVSMRMRMRLLSEARARGWTLALDHEAGEAVVRVEVDPSKPGVYSLQPAHVGDR